MIAAVHEVDKSVILKSTATKNFLLLNTKKRLLAGLRMASAFLGQRKLNLS